MDARVALERQEAERRRAEEEAARVAEERRAREVEEALQRTLVRMHWRRWGRRALVPPDVRDAKQSLRIAVRLPRDGRVIHHFSHTATLTTLYAFVDGYLIPRELDPADDPHASPDGMMASGEEAMECAAVSGGAPEEWWGFRLVLAYPRREITWEPRVKLCDVECLKGGGQVMVELIGTDGDAEAYNSD
jgi:FAS-associated factor 2